MARMKLKKQDQALKNLGKVLFKAGFDYQDARPKKMEIAEATKQEILQIIDDENGILEINLVFDDTVYDENKNITKKTRNIIVPSVSGKTLSLFNTNDYLDVSGMAEESLGFIVIMGCGD